MFEGSLNGTNNTAKKDKKNVKVDKQFQQDYYNA